MISTQTSFTRHRKLDRLASSKAATALPPPPICKARPQTYRSAANNIESVGGTSWTRSLSRVHRVGYAVAKKKTGRQLFRAPTWSLSLSRSQSQQPVFSPFLVYFAAPSRTAIDLRSTPSNPLLFLQFPTRPWNFSTPVDVPRSSTRRSTPLNREF